MAFEGLSQKIQTALRKLSGRGKIQEADLKAAMREVRMALLEADVNYAVVRDFVKQVSEKALGADVLQSLSPDQMVIKIVHEEMIALLGGTNAKLTVSPRPITVYMLCGLQGAGKTTMAGKLALYLRKSGKKPLPVACDVYRPAAIEQLGIVAKNIDIPFFEMGQSDPVLIAQKSLEKAEYMGYDTVILDTAGRLHVDEQLMDELSRMREKVKPQEILLVVDAMTGQDAVNVATSFNEKLGIDGVILTKLDGDTRGGAAISVKAVTGKPIKFSGIGEKPGDLEPFYPDRMASRILGMGDVLTLIEKAQESFDEAEAIKLEKRIRENAFTLEDFLTQFEKMKKMGSMADIINMLPGGNKISAEDIDEKAMARTEAIIKSMTIKERRNPDLLNASRRKRIAAGSGTTVQEVNRLMKQFEQVQQMMKQLSGRGAKGLRRKMRGMNLPF